MFSFLSILQILLFRFHCDAFLWPILPFSSSPFWLKRMINTSHRCQPSIRLLLSSDKLASTKTTTKMTTMIKEPDENESSFGRMGYWNESYRQAQPDNDSNKNNNKNRDKEQGLQKGEVVDTTTNVVVYSWYCGWIDELGPFFTELFPDRNSFILIPGIGNDVCIRDMYDVGGYHRLMAFDYAPQGVECAKKMFGNGRIQTIQKEIMHRNVTNTAKPTATTNIATDADADNDIFLVCDARDLSSEYNDNMFDGVLDKGTFDSVYLSGGKNKTKSKMYLSMAVSEMKRIVKVNGIVFSVTAACVDAVREAFDEAPASAPIKNSNDGEDNNDDNLLYWKPLRDGGLHITDDGYTSNNVDATMLVWQLTKR
mmetsp:Transcript_56305/g.63866  ORF Transcript_56305/g.63866 Transcript_56305/m.63866 type:complete len:368 (+) Transcript_56305:118-1221(+)